jgi:acetoin utilization deacetylase AcuC-like enzyme
MSWNDIKFYYADHFEVPLSDKHRFPMDKYRLLRNSLITQGIIKKENCHPSVLISKELLLLAHDSTYVDEILSLSLDPKKARPIGLPLNKEMVNRTLASSQAFTHAVDESLIHGYGASFAGGTHHAHFDAGEGFCFFNDFAINVRRLYKLYPQKNILILDLDVHQGNGNSSILKNDPNVFIVSFHGKSNYPYRKIDSHIDVAFENNTTDDIYLSKLEEVIKKLKLMNFDHIFYQAGVDTLQEDSFGKLSLTHEGLLKRDELVFKWAFESNIPIASAIGGGYAKDINQTVEAYIGTFKTAKKYFNG